MIPVRWVGYTTRYREGGPQMRRAAQTLARTLQAPDVDVRCEAVESRSDVLSAMARIPEGTLQQLHLVSHSGMYGPMFGSRAYPEQFSPHEWRTMTLPFAPDAEAWFHACRTARWFAPFFARTFHVPAHGHHGYTTFSRDPLRYRYAAPDDQGPCHVIGQPGRKSHGWVGSVGKHSGWLPPEPMQRHLPQAADGASYDRVAAMYDRVFADIRVRGPEWRWIDARVPPGVRLLDVGCGTGALLRALGPRLREGVGVDASEGMLARARVRSAHPFVRVDGPQLPFGDDRFDVAVSLLSWRYLDADPLLAELSRVLRPGGRLLLVDMVASPSRTREWPLVAAHALRARWHQSRFPGFVATRAELVSSADWAKMLHYNPIRAEHELRWSFESRFPGCRIDTLDVGVRARVLAVEVSF